MKTEAGTKNALPSKFLLTRDGGCGIINCFYTQQMVKDLPAVLQTEFEILSAQLSREKASREGRDKTQTFFSEGSYGGQSSFWPGLAAEGAVKTNRSLFLFIILTF